MKSTTFKIKSLGYENTKKPEKLCLTDCHDTAEAMRLLEAFLVLQRSREEDRARILDELSE